MGAALAMLAVLAVGCGQGGGDDNDDAARQAAATYRTDLEHFAAELKGAGRTELARFAAKPPALEAVESDEASYAAAGELAGRVEPIAAELSLLANVDPREEAKFQDKLYSLALGFADSVIERSSDYQFSGKVLESDATTQRRATAAIKREIAAWKPYRRKVAAVPARDELSRSLLKFELEEIDATIAIFEEYRRHLQQHKPDKATTAYWDNIWPLEDPLRLLPAGVFASKGDPYLDSLYGAKRIISSQVRAIQTLARAGEVGADSPSVGDAYRAAILAGFVSPLEKVKFEAYRINFRAWMLDRVRELEGTPRPAYDDAQQTIWTELIDDDRNPYDKLLAALAGFNAIGVSEPDDVARLKVYLQEMDEQLAGPIAPILEPTRKGFLRALDVIRVKDLEYGTSKLQEIGEYTEITNAYSRGSESLTEARKKIQRAMRGGAEADRLAEAAAARAPASARRDRAPTGRVAPQQSRLFTNPVDIVVWQKMAPERRTVWI